MTKTIYYNIETIPPLGTKPNPDKVKAPANYKREQTIREYQIDHAEEQWAKAALEPLEAQVFCLSHLFAAKEEPTVTMNTDEMLLFQWLESQVRIWKQEARLRWVTYNGLGFDFPLSRLRALRYRCPVLAEEMTTLRWGNDTHVDLRLQLNSDSRASGTLDEYAAFFGLSTYGNPISGSEIARCISMHAHDKVLAHTRSRVLILRDLDLLVNGSQDVQ